MTEMRVGVSNDKYELLKKAAEKRGVSIKSLVDNIIEKVGIADKEEKIILSVPVSLTKRNKEAFKEWLQIKADALVGMYYPK